MMNNKMKGLLKGLRYISQIFDEEEKEEEEEEKEMQIGYPTDVKHVAHFGCDGPSAANPSWMGEYQFTSASSKGKELEAPIEDIRRLSINPIGSSTAEPLPQSPAKEPHRRRSSASESPLGSDPHSGRDKDSTNRENRHSRRHHSAGSSSSAGNSSSAMEPSDGSFRRRRRHSKPSTTGSDSPAGDASSAPKQSRRRKSKGETSSASSVAVGIP